MRYYQIPPEHPPDPLIIASAALTRARAEVRLLATIAPIGRWGMALGSRAGIALDTFAADDTRAIFAALRVADRDGRIVHREATYLLARRALIIVSLWDDSDTRPFASGMRWGPAALAALFTRVSRREAEVLVPILSADLLSRDAQREAA